MRALTVLGAVVSSMLIAASAQAQDKATAFGSQGQYILSANRLFSVFAYTNNKISPDGVQNADTTYNATSIALVGGTPSAALGAGAAGVGAANGTFYNVPRFGFDYAIIDKLTIGGEAILFFNLGGSAHLNGSSTSQDLASGNVWGLAPRVGYVIGMTDMLSIWLRGGLHYYNAQVNTAAAGPGACSPPASAAHVFGLDLDPTLVISPGAHVGVMVGPVLDWGFLGGGSVPAGTSCSATNNFSYTSLNFGITSGLLGTF